MAYQHHGSVSPDTLIETKFQCGRTIVRQSLPFKDFDPILLPKRVCELFGVPSTSELLLERYSDTSASFVPMNDPDPIVESNAYKTLIRAAKAKKKLRFRVFWKPAVAAAPEVAPAPTTTPVSVLDPFVFSDVTNAASSTGSPCSTASTSSSKLEKTRMEELDIALSKLKSVSIAAIPNPTTRIIYHPTPATLDSGNITTLPGNSTSVYCNSCNKNFLEEHYHCDTCNGGQFDICPECHDANKRCDSDKHWFIKRTVAPDGTIITSTTQKFVSDAKKQSVCRLQEPQQASADIAAAVDEAGAKVETDTEDADSRTCNGCVQILPEHAFVTCYNCPDFDLCFPCLEQGDHGHHPAHTFGLASSSQSSLSPEHAKLCRPGRNVAHQAICDNCDEAIQGVRFKCQDCPDWDYCHDCIHKARINHANNHRFAPIYEAIPLSPIHTDYLSSNAIHYGINCDGPLCVSRKLHIRGIRYKCAVCNDVDFCANCEASPSLVHSRSHPLIKIRSPIRGCSVTTKVDCPTANVYLGDYIASHRRCHRHGQGHGKSKPKRETKVESSQQEIKKDAELLQQIKGKNLEENSAKEDINAMEPEQEAAKEKNQPKSVKLDEHDDHLSETAVSSPFSQFKTNGLTRQQKLTVKQFYHSGDLARLQTQFTRELDAEFVLDYIKDGSIFTAGSTFMQRWVLKNSGTKAWPAGSSIRYVGGDLMLGAKTTESSVGSSTRQCTETNAVGHEVLPGQSFGFDIALKASTDPKYVGCSISYWRLHTPSGKPFGPRVWCHINLVPAVAIEEGRSLSKKESAPASALAAFLKQTAEKNKEVKDVDMVSLRAQVYTSQVAARQANNAEALRQMGILREYQKVADARRSLLEQGLHNLQTLSHARIQQTVPTVVNGSTQTATEAKTAIVESPIATNLRPNAEFQVIAAEPVVVQCVSKPVVVEKAAIVVATEEKAEVAHLEAPAVISTTPTLMEIVDMTAGEDESTEIEKFDQEDLVLFEDAETISVTDSEGDSEGVSLFEDDDYELLQTSDEESVA